MAESLRGGLSLTSSGFGFWSHDIGGFESKSTADVYKRWAAFGLLSTHSRLHGSTSYRVPWLYDEEAVDVVRFFTRLKLSLMPYLYTSAAFTSRTGVPMLRSMALEFEDDPACAYLDRQYMLGDSLLAAPIFNEKGQAEYYLPRGRWTNLLTGETAEGGWRKERHDYCSMPLWVRENTILPMGISFENADYGFEGNVELRVYELSGRAEAKVEQNGRAVLEAEACCEDGNIRLQVKGRGLVRVRFVNRRPEQITVGKVRAEGRDTVLEFEADEQGVRICAGEKNG